MTIQEKSNSGAFITMEMEGQVHVVVHVNAENSYCAQYTAEVV